MSYECSGHETLRRTESKTENLNIMRYVTYDLADSSGIGGDLSYHRIREPLNVQHPSASRAFTGDHFMVPELKGQ